MSQFNHTGLSDDDDGDSESFPCEDCGEIITVDDVPDEALEVGEFVCEDCWDKR